MRTDLKVREVIVSRLLKVKLKKRVGEKMREEKETCESRDAVELPSSFCERAARSWTSKSLRTFEVLSSFVLQDPEEARSHDNPTSAGTRGLTSLSGNSSRERML